MNRVKTTFFCRIICGITENTESSHIIKATLSAVCFQVRDVLESMNKDYGSPVQKLQVNFHCDKCTINFSTVQFDIILFKL